MTSIGGSEPVAPAPFGEGHGRLPMQGGCGRAGLIGCGLVILLLGIGAIVLLFKADDFLAWALTRMEREIVAVMPAECDPVVAERLHAAFGAAIKAIVEGSVDPVALQEFMRTFNRNLPDAAGSISCEQVRELTVLLEGLGGVAADEAALTGRRRGNPAEATSG